MQIIEINYLHCFAFGLDSIFDRVLVFFRLIFLLKSSIVEAGLLWFVVLPAHALAFNLREIMPVGDSIDTELISILVKILAACY